MREIEQNPIDMYIGQKLREYRVKRKMTLSDLAEMLEVSHQQIHKYELGQTKIPASTLYKLACVFSASPNCFFDGFDPQKFKISFPGDNDRIVFKPERSVNVLLVEDNAADEFLVRKVFESCPLKINLYVLHEGEGVLEFLRRKWTLSLSQRPDLIILDLHLPDISGLSLLKSIKVDRDLQDIPTLILTSSVSRKDMVAVYKNYAGGYICKSLDFQTFKKNMLTAMNYWCEAVVLPTAD